MAIGANTYHIFNFGINCFTALTLLMCDNNQLTNLDVTQNNALTGLLCRNNKLTSLNVSNNTALTELVCDVNQLTCLNIKNGNNNLITYFWPYNPNLTCIELDDPNWATQNWGTNNG
tara:strand:- start:412 stop:762 length:351 start_codon:yes stop_codon:yes gene_type:complete